MPLGTLDPTPPPFFRQGPSALTKLVFFGLLALLLMVADLRFSIARPLRAGVAVVLYPVQWLVLRPLQWAQDGAGYLESLQTSREQQAAAQYRLGLQSQRAQQVEQLQLENTRLRELLQMRERLQAPALAAQVLYDAADPYTRKIIVDKGHLSAVQAGAPVIDEAGVLGQVTRVYAGISEVTLITDRNQAIPVQNMRTGVRGLAFGDSAQRSGLLELRFMDANVEMQPGDLLTTSGIDGVYPPGLAVATVARIERRADSAFARITCEPMARVAASAHVLILKSVSAQIEARPNLDANAPLVGKAGAR